MCFIILSIVIDPDFEGFDLIDYTDKTNNYNNSNNIVNSVGSPNSKNETYQSMWAAISKILLNNKIDFSDENIAKAQ